MLYGMCASGRDLAPTGVRDSVVALVRAHWGLGLRALAGAFVTDPTAEDLAGFARFRRASASAGVAARLTARTLSPPQSRHCSPHLLPCRAQSGSSATSAIQKWNICAPGCAAAA